MPPVGWHRTCEQPWQTTTVWACEKTVVMVKQPGHLTSMKKERGPGTRVLQWVSLRPACEGLENANLELVLAGLGRGSRVEEINGENLHAKNCQHQVPVVPMSHRQQQAPMGSGRPSVVPIAEANACRQGRSRVVSMSSASCSGSIRHLFLLLLLLRARVEGQAHHLGS